MAPLDDYPSGFVVLLLRSPFAFVSDSSGPNVRTREIASLRHPNVFIPCFDHIFVLLCGDYMNASLHSTVVAKSQNIVTVFNSSSSFWFPLLQLEVNLTLVTSLSLLSAVATRWNSTWLSAVSLLQAQDSLLSMLNGNVGKDRVQEAFLSTAIRHKSLRDVVEIARDTSFFNELGMNLDTLIPSIESSLLIRGGSETLKDPMYCFARQ
jgi:hypothetical protein